MSIVKLQVYEHKQEEIVLDTFDAKTWDDFLIIRVAGLLDNETINNLRAVVEEFTAERPEKHVILIPDDMNISFCGVRPNE